MLTLPLLLLGLPLPGGLSPPVPPQPLECGAALQQVELKVGAPAVPVCIAPEVTTTLRFDMPLAVDRTEVQGSGVVVTPSPTRFMLEATQALEAGEQRQLTVYFADGNEPASATFTLIVQAEGTPRQVDVLRQPRTAASLRQEAEQQRRRAETCELREAQREARAAPSSLLKQILPLDTAKALPLKWQWSELLGGVEGNVKVEVAQATQLAVGEGRYEAAVRLNLYNGSTEGWTVEGASLTPREGAPLAEVRVLSGTLIPAAVAKDIHILVGPMPRQLKGTHTLRLWGGGREARMEGLTFPAP